MTPDDIPTDRSLPISNSPISITNSSSSTNSADSVTSSPTLLSRRAASNPATSACMDRSHRSRSPSSRPLSGVQTLLRSFASTTRLTVSSPPTNRADFPSSGNSLRRPVEIVPAGTEGVTMPPTDFALSLPSTGVYSTHQVVPSSSSPSQSTGTYAGLSPALSSSSTIHPNHSLSPRTSITNLQDSSRSSSMMSTTYPPNSTPVTPGGGATQPGPRAHVRASGRRSATPLVQSPSSTPSTLLSSSRRLSPSSSEYTASIAHTGVDSQDAILSHMLSIPSSEPRSFSPYDNQMGEADAESLGPQSSVFKNQITDSPARTNSLLRSDLEMNDLTESLLSFSMDDRDRSVSIEMSEPKKGEDQGLGEVRRRSSRTVDDRSVEIELRDSIQQGLSFPTHGQTTTEGSRPSPDDSGAMLKEKWSAEPISFFDQASSASSKPNPGSYDAWDWESFNEAYRHGRWDAYKIPNPPLSCAHLMQDAQSPTSRANLRASSSSAPPSSVSPAPPKAKTPPVISSSKSVTPTYKPPPSASSTTFETGSDRIIEMAQPPGSIRSKDVEPAFLSKKKKPFMHNAEFAATVRLAGASSHLSPLALPSPEHEHVDPLRELDSSSSTSYASDSSSNIHRPRKASKMGFSWSVSSGGLLPTGRTASFGNLGTIPATPQTEDGPGNGGVIGEGISPLSTLVGGTLPLPMATAPLPASERRKASDPGQDDYFGESVGAWVNATSGLGSESGSRRGSVASSVGGDDGPNSTGSGNSSRTVLGRGYSYTGTFGKGGDSKKGELRSTASGGEFPFYKPHQQLSQLELSPKDGSTESLKASDTSEALKQFLSQPFTPSEMSVPSPAPSSSVPSSGFTRLPLFTAKSDGDRKIHQASKNMLGNYPPVVANDGAQKLSPQEERFTKLGYLSAPKPPDEAERRKALYRYDILHSGQDINFDRITHLVKLVFNTKIVLITLLDTDEQWYKSENGMRRDRAGRGISICAHTILQRSHEPLIILDTFKDWRFARNPLVIGDPNIRFYAGAPLRTSDGFNIGSLCIIDDKPHDSFAPRQRHVLKEFAAVVMRELELWRDKLHLRRRGKIQDSMERFTRECVEMDVSPESVDVALTKVYDQAAKLIQKTLDVDGAMVLDLSAFELVETVQSDGTNSFYFQADPYQMQTAPPSHQDHEEGDVTPGEEKPQNYSEPVTASDQVIPCLPILGLAENGLPPPSRGKPVSAVEHQKLAAWLKENPNGKVFERVLPSWFRSMLPSGIQYAMLVPVFNIDKNPFTFVCAYTKNAAKEFLEGYELKYLRAIGLITLSAVLKRRLTLADKAKANFISNISHELRTPLHGILVSGELLSDTDLTPQQTSYLQTVQACGTSLIETVNHVLDFTKLSGSARTKSNAENNIQFTEVDLVKLIEETVEGCWFSATARVMLDQSGIGSVYSPPSITAFLEVDKPANKLVNHVECIIDVGHRPQGWKVKCEKSGIRRVLMNLIGNSLKFTQDGYVLITLRELPNAQDNVLSLELAVIDTGKGISSEFLKNQLFQPFSQENPLHTGTGLGLAIVNSIVSSPSVNGKVDVWSSEGLGTEIKVSFEAELMRDQGPPNLPFEFGDGYSVSLIGFSPEHRGQSLARDVIENYLEDLAFEIRDPSDLELGDIILLNEEVIVLDELVAQNDIYRPVVVLTTSRGALEQNRAVNAYVAAGGFAHIVYKPAGPSKVAQALQACTESLASSHMGAQTTSHWGRRSFNQSSATSHSSSGSDRLSNCSSPPVSFGTALSGVDESEVTYFSGAFGSSGAMMAAAHQVSPAHFLQRRRSEEERDHRRRIRRPMMAPRSITFQPDTALPLAIKHSSAFSSNPSIPNSRRTPQHSEDEQSTPSSPGSIISVGGGGAVLKAATTSEGDIQLNHERVKKAPSVLVVEDNVINRRVLSAYLQKRKYPFMEAVNGQEGVNMFRSQPDRFFDVCLMDVQMPVLDGIGATKAIRQLEADRRSLHVRSTSSVSNDPNQPDYQNRLKILALTGLATPDDKKRAFASGVDGYLVKPVSMKDLDNIFRKLGYGT